MRISDWSSDVCSSDLGYGLSYAKPGEVAQLPVDAAESCGEVTALPIFNLTDAPTFALHVATADAEHALGSDLNTTPAWARDKPALRVRTVQVNTQPAAQQVPQIGRAACRERECQNI